MLINCKEIHDIILEQEKYEMNCEYTPMLSVIKVGDSKESDAYEKGIIKDCEKIGIKVTSVQLSSNICQYDLNKCVKNCSDTSKGVILQLPLPKNLSIKFAMSYIVPRKDIDGFRDDSEYIPATAKGIIMLLEKLNMDLNSKNCVIIGRSKHIGRAVAKELLNRNCTTTICHSYTEDVSMYTKCADIIITAVGVPGFIRPNMIKDGALLIDVGTTVVDGKIVGDVDISCAEKADLTPVPGGIGLMTRVALIDNLLN